ncbi:EamA family transporter [Mesoterricola silvestris]|uniref:Membrane protein n=1 Tax=Mesoterricola silvestris TaxID=2927979 RepID=A0AA48GK95_9BACT|nr:EamA family transporter [Mesoterricola silvestris]BDU71309.1 putative membrane protein [Mesoterricola silvestris]
MAFLLAVSILWALSFGLIPRVSPMGAPFVAAARSVLALALFLPFLRVKGLAWRHRSALALVGALQFGLMYVFYTASFRWLLPGEVALFTIFTPILVALADDVLSRRVSWPILGAAALAVAGTAICLGTRVRQEGVLRGFLLMMASNACFAAGQILYRRLARKLSRPDHQLMGLLYAGAAAVTLAIAAPGVDVAKVLHATPTQFLVLAYLGLVASGLGFFLFNAGARRVDVGTLAVFNNAKVPLAILASAVVFGERVEWFRLGVGGGVIAVAFLLGKRRP